MNATAFDLKTYLTERRALVDSGLRQQLDNPSPTSRICQAMSYSVMAGGKRLRPILCMAAAEAVGGNRESVLPIACALELIHTYSLIHDDLPAMDNDEKRRGKPTCHVQFDEATAILAGDALLTLAFEVLAAAASRCPSDAQQRWLQATIQIASAAGSRGMIEGQMRDMDFEGKRIAADALESLHRLKTGRMIEAAIGSGAMVAGASEAQQKALEGYGRHIGLAFQVADDILNVTGDPQRLGKATGTDRSRGKNTYPALLGLDAARRFAEHLVDGALQVLAPFDIKADPLRAIARYVIERSR